MPRIHINEWPPYAPSDQAKKENVLLVARLMANAALTAPVSGGVPSFEAEIAYGEEDLELIAREMERLAHQGVSKKLRNAFLYEAAMLRESDVVLFLGSVRAHSTPMDAACGLCSGEPNCSFFYDRVQHVEGIVDTTDRSRNTAVKGPLCMLRGHDLGYAIGSALWIAATHFVDCKPFYSVGLAGRNLNHCRNSEVVVGIPMAVMSKNPYVDIPPDYHLVNMNKQVDAVRKTFVIMRQLAMSPYQIRDVERRSGRAENEQKEE